MNKKLYILSDDSFIRYMAKLNQMTVEEFLEFIDNPKNCRELKFPHQSQTMLWIKKEN